MEKKMTEDVLLERVLATVYATPVSRDLVTFEWPECHKAKCNHRHGSTDQAFGYFKHALAASLSKELAYRLTTRPDVAEAGDSAEAEAVYVLAALLYTYRPEMTSTYVNAARLIVDAYPQVVAALTTSNAA